jgi:hypothetical protein
MLVKLHPEDLKTERNWDKLTLFRRPDQCLHVLEQIENEWWLDFC